ncbi:MAG TPA: ABC transporter permease subunit, partial [Elusimicrobiota bacterium]|nr:ABC transporter permease subunit [Elusimicrobiota bacterium]
METIKAVFDYTFREHVRNKVWLSAALFGLVLLTGGLVASALAQQERARMMLDLGLAANELIGLVLMVFLTVHLILQEIESRAVYLILSHPVRRWQYLLGRFAGTLAAVGAGMAGMGLAHWGLLAAFGWGGGGSYPLAWSCSFAAVAVMGALALLLSLVLTSEAAAMAFSGFFWILGHFTAEIRFVAEKSGNAVLRTALLAFSHAAPDFAHFDYRDAWHAGPPSRGWIAAAALYALGYCAACLALATQVFEQ